jgi:hypothetical protein
LYTVLDVELFAVQPHAHNLRAGWKAGDLP